MLRTLFIILQFHFLAEQLENHKAFLSSSMFLSKKIIFVANKWNKLITHIGWKAMANDENTWEWAWDSQVLWILHFRIKMSKRIAPINCYGFGSSWEYVAELARHNDLVALQKKWLFPLGLSIPSTHEKKWKRFFLFILKTFDITMSTLYIHKLKLSINYSD